MNHGTPYAYKRLGCRCAACTDANNEANRRWRANRKARGDRYVRKDREYAEKRPCTACDKLTHARGPEPLCHACSLHLRRMPNVSQRVRAEIYERDGWICQFCSYPVDPTEASPSPGAATLDHVVPRSLGGTDDPSNLRLLHRYCNSVRSNRDALTIDELAA